MDRNRHRQSAKRSSSWYCSCRFSESGSRRDITEKKTNRQASDVQRIVRYQFTCARRIVILLIVWSYTKSLGFKCLFLNHKLGCFGSVIKAPTVLMTSETRALQEHLKNYLFFSCVFFFFLICNNQFEYMYTQCSTENVYVCCFNNDNITFMILYFLFFLFQLIVNVYFFFFL